MKLIAYLLSITATGVATWLYLRKKSAKARLQLPKSKKTRKLLRKLHPVHHKRNGMASHSAH